MPRLSSRRVRLFAFDLHYVFVRWLLAAAFAICGALPAAAEVADLPTLLSVDKEQLKPGQFVWFAEADSTIPLTIVVSLSQQLVYVYRERSLIALSTISSGRKGYATPTGTFTILERKRKHTSNLYDAPMPFMLRLTWDGVALHGGDIPGYRASHGCIRLPMGFSRELFAVAPAVETVIVTDEDVVEGMYDYHAMADVP